MIIRDPLYNYLYLTKTEQVVLDNPLFQRLRYVSQNGAAYHTYPSNHSCRFLHSLGAMEVAGRMVSSVFLNSSEEYLANMIEKGAHLINDCIRLSRNASVPLNNLEAGAVEEESLVVYRHYGLASSLLEEWVKECGTRSDSEELPKAVKEQFVQLIIFESVRLSAMLHDLGHFPYSHSLEDAFIEEGDESLQPILETFREKHESLCHIGALHERVGIDLLDVVLPEDGLGSFERLCRMIARKILSSAADDKSIVALLHSFVAGDLDADRLDYCMRDPRFSGMELGAFDLDRITSNILLVQNENGELCTAPSIKALPAVESFFHQRYLVYKNIIYHHATARMNELIKIIVHELALLYVSNAAPKLVKYLDSRHFSYLWKCCNKELFYLCTENWLFSLVSDMLDREEIFVENLDDTVSSKIKSILLMARTFVLRESSNFVTLTKRDRYDEFLEFVEEELRKSPDSEFLADDKGSTAELVLAVFVTNGRAIFHKIEKKYKLRVMFLITKPKTIFGQDNEITVNVVRGDGTVVKASECSPYLASIKLCIAEDQQFHVVLLGDKLKSRGSARIGRIKKELAAILAHHIAKERSENQNGGTN